MNRPRLVGRILPLWVAALLVLTGLAARAVALRSWTGVVEYRSPYTATVPPGAPGRPLARQVILVIADGLRLDAFLQTGFVKRFGEQAAVARAWVDEPSLSFPGWTTIVTGAPPEISGVTTNWYRGAVKTDHLFAAARRAGMAVGVAGHPGWGQLFGLATPAFVSVPDPPYTSLAAIHDTSVTVARAGERFIREQIPLIVLHFPAPDLMGHGFGGSSQPYDDTVRVLDEELTRLAGAANRSAATLIVTADHGHLDTGGHGGWERVVREVPLLLMGAGIEPGEGLVARAADIAPTVAALLGLPLPGHAIGRPLIEAMADVPEDLYKRWEGQQGAFYQDVYSQGLLGRHGVLYTAPVGRAVDPDEAILAAADGFAQQVSQWRAGALTRDRLKRLPVALVIGLAPLPLLVTRRLRRDLLPAGVGAAIFLAATLGMFFGQGYYYSLSVINTESRLEAFFEQRTLEAAIAIAGAALIAGWGARRRGTATGLTVGVTTSLLAAYALVLQALYFFVLWGISFPRYLPDLRLGFKFYLDLLALVPVAVLAPALPVASLTGYGIGRLWERLFGRRTPSVPGPSPAEASAPTPGEPSRPLVNRGG